jgi:hypothetical protein
MSEDLPFKVVRSYKPGDTTSPVKLTNFGGRCLIDLRMGVGVGRASKPERIFGPNPLPQPRLSANHQRDEQTVTRGVT